MELLIGAGGLAVSAVMLVATAGLVAVRTGTTASDRFWIGLFVVQAELGTVAVTCSLLNALDARAFLLTQAGVLAAVTAIMRSLRREPVRRPTAGWRISRPADRITVALAVGLALVLLVSGLRQLASPLVGFDDRMYHASRVAYWMQYGTLFFRETHNQRQTVFPFGSELWFAWPLLFTKLEVVGRMVSWLGLPLGALGVHTVAMAIGLSARARLAATLVYAATPTVLLQATSLGSDLWLPVFLVGAAYFAVRSPLPGEAPWRRHLLAGLFLALAMNVKATAMALGPGLVLAALLETGVVGRTRAIMGLVTGVLTGAVLSGLIVLMGWNAAQYGHPLGPPALSQVVQSDLSLRQLSVHAARTPLTLLELPMVPGEGLRDALKRAGEAVARITGADTQLSLEEGPVWPGRFSIAVPPWAVAYSLGGLLWLPCLAVALALACREITRSWPDPKLSAASTLAVIQVPVLLGVVFFVRWMSGAGGPARFWIGAYMLSVAVTVFVLQRISRRSELARLVIAIALTWTVGAALASEASRLREAMRRPVDMSRLDEPYHAVLPALPAGARILLVASQDTRDYPLFNPRRGFANRVFAWGRWPFESRRADAFLREHQITHVLIENEMRVGFHWAGEMATAEMVEWMRARPDFREVPLQSPPLRLFERPLRAEPRPRPTRARRRHALIGS